MAFDFNANPLRLYSLWPEAPFPIEVSIYGYCASSCSFCFANRNRDAFERELNEHNSAPALFRRLERALADEYDPIGFFLREKYPVVFSNTTDPFQRAEKQHRATEAFLGWAKANQVPLSIQTRGNVLFEEWDRYKGLLEPGRAVVYLSICQTDDRVRRRHEPGALATEKRWELARRLSDHGIPVIAACNPYTPAWVPDPAEYCELAREAGCRAVVVDRLHLSSRQLEHVADTYEAELSLLANLPPGILLPLLRKWKEAAEATGLVLDATAQWNGLLGLSCRHVEGADASWLGGKLFDFCSRVLNAVEAMGERALIGWPALEEALEVLGVPNPSLDVSAFWYAYNQKISADRASWNAALGKRAGLWDVLRYWWNHPYENEGLLWFDHRMRPVWDPQTRLLLNDESGNAAGLYDPARCLSDPKDAGLAEIDLAGTSWPRFKE